MIRETITFKFLNEDQQRRFHDELNRRLTSVGLVTDYASIGRDRVLAEREACAKLADLQAALDRRQAERHADADNSFNDCAITAESIARAIRFRTNLENSN